MRSIKRLIKGALKRAMPAFIARVGNYRATRDASKGHRSFDAMAGILGWILTLAKQEFPDFSPEGKRALEIGTGKFFAHALLLYICGCKEVMSVDKNRQLSLSAVRRAASAPALARRFLSPHVSHDQYIIRLRTLQDTNFNLNRLSQLGIIYDAPLDLMHSPHLDERFDLAFSYTVLEHINPSEIVAFLKESTKKLVSGGICVHFIDLEDHADALHAPFAFLASNSKWEEEFCAERGNRMRFSAWKKAINSVTGIDWRIPYIAVRHDAELPSSIDDQIKYENEDDVRTTALLLVGKRQAGSK